ncbi:CPBP family glutamic-type intramembrane protease [Amedibacillus sp. YH-ame6]
MYCRYCGKELDEKAVMCPGCGKMLDESLLPKKSKHETESYVCNATAGALLALIGSEVGIILCMVPFMVAMMVSDMSTSYYGMYDFENSMGMITFTNVSTIVATVGATLFVVYLFKKSLKITIPTLKKNPFSFGKILYYTGIGMGLSSIAGFLIFFLNMFLNIFGIALTTPDFSLQYDLLNNILMFIMVCIVAPIFEELLYRGLILTALKRFGNMFAIIITSILFALAHGNIPQTIPTFFISLVLCYVVLRSNSLLPAILIHFINNAISMVATMYMDNNIVSIGFTIFEIALILFACIALFLKREKIASYIKKHKGASLLSYFKHITPIIYLVIYLLIIAFSVSLVNLVNNVNYI